MVITPGGTARRRLGGDGETRNDDGTALEAAAARGREMAKL